jgi:hypothetical protein
MLVFIKDGDKVFRVHVTPLWLRRHTLGYTLQCGLTLSPKIARAALAGLDLEETSIEEWSAHVNR